MNPFDLPGPQFLLFYVSVVLVLAAILWISRHQGEQANSLAVPEITDPYLVAYLRAGPTEVWRLATIRLVDRGLLQAEGSTISVVAGATADNSQNEVERATLKWFSTPGEAISVINESSLQPLVRPYEDRLIELGLLPNKNAKTNNKLKYALAVSVLVLVALFKIILALNRGHKNVVFLFLIGIGSVIALYTVAMPRHTRKGHAVLEDLKGLFARLKDAPDAIRAGQSNAEVMWLAAVFGVGALAFSHVRDMYPRAQSSGSCGSSCGSSCGGGGCGGGCGGCGG